MSIVKVSCTYCSKEIKRPLRDYNRYLKKGYKNFYCDNSCQGKHKRELTKNKILGKGSQKCGLCKQEKKLSEFNKNRSKSSGFNTVCKVCSKKRSRLYYKENSEKHKKEVRKRVKLFQINLRNKIFNFLKQNPCVDCGENNPIVLEFDHRDTKNKDFTISVGYSKKYSWKKIKKEIDKCDVRCANCHRKRTAKQFNWYKNIVI